jgi:hypothetical protein
MPEKGGQGLHAYAPTWPKTHAVPECTEIHSPTTSSVPSGALRQKAGERREFNTELLSQNSDRNRYRGRDRAKTEAESFTPHGWQSGTTDVEVDASNRHRDRYRDRDPMAMAIPKAIAIWDRAG